jgi:hypothetical protein
MTRFIGAIVKLSPLADGKEPECLLFPAGVQPLAIAAHALATSGDSRLERGARDAERIRAATSAEEARSFRDY